MAMIQCPECGKQISDKAQNCPNCGCPSECFHQPVEYMEEPEVYQQPVPNQTDTSGASRKILFGFLAGVIAILAYFAKSYVFMLLMGGFALVEFSQALTSVSGNSAQEPQKDKRLRCANCGGYQISVSVSTVKEVYGSTREVREKNKITRKANHAGRAFMNVATLGLWSITPKRSDYRETEKVKSRNIQYKTAVCQSCGYSWNL